jgi:NADH-quinone oxidoreductase subunit N
MQSLDLIQSLKWYMPEVVLITIIFAILIGDLFVSKSSRMSLAFFLSFAGLLMSMFLTLDQFIQLKEPFKLFFGALQIDGFIIFFKFVIFLLGILILGMAYWTREISDGLKPEQVILMLIVLLGGTMLISAGDLLTAYLGMETVSILSYALVGFHKKDRLSSESATKYVVYGALSSGIMLFGMSLLYGVAGTLEFDGIRTALLQSSVASSILIFIFLMIFMGVAFKISAFPMWMWTPDVYQGAPTPVTAFLSVGPKAAGFAFLIRFTFGVVSEISGDSIVFIAGIDWPIMMAWVAAITMTVGNLAALGQTSLKRLLAFSSIAHAGYMLMGLAVADFAGITAVMFYFIAYLAMNLGAFLVVSLLINRFKSDKIEDFSGLAWSAPFICVSAVIFLFSLIGLPPFAGFVGKVYLFSAVVNKEIYWLAVIGVLNSVVSLYYYAKFIKVMFFKPASDQEGVNFSLTFFQKAALIVFVIPTVFLGIYWTPVINFAEQAVQNFPR